MARLVSDTAPLFPPARPGTTDFRAALAARHPRRPGEPLIKGYFPRLCQSESFRRAGVTPRRMKDLWYGSYGRCRDGFSAAEVALFFGPDSGPSTTTASELLTSTLARDLEEARQRQRKQDEKILQVIRALLGVLDEHLSLGRR
jgi:hypothetical protein